MVNWLINTTVKVGQPVQTFVMVNWSTCTQWSYLISIHKIVMFGHSIHTIDIFSQSIHTKVMGSVNTHNSTHLSVNDITIVLVGQSTIQSFISNGWSVQQRYLPYVQGFHPLRTLPLILKLLRLPPQSGRKQTKGLSFDIFIYKLKL